MRILDRETPAAPLDASGSLSDCLVFLLYAFWQQQ
jgi:hypothetical protein